MSLPTLELRSDIDIGAPTSTVWEIITDFARYSEWNPLIRRLDGPCQSGARVQGRFEPFPGRAISSAVTITELAAPRVLAWSGRKGLPRMLDGVHRYELEPTATGCHVSNVEVFRGVLVPLAAPILKRTLPTYHRSNEALRARAEVFTNASG